MEELIAEMLSKKVWAVLGVSTNPDKFGYKVYKTLKNSGYTVYPVNPKTTVIDGERCYDSLNSLPQKPEVVNFVIPPKLTEIKVDECIKLGIKNLWIQPGAGNPTVVKKAIGAGLNIIYSRCVMVELGKLQK